MARASNMFHPLCGSNLTTLVRLLLTNGSIEFKHLPKIAFALIVASLRLPFSTLERVIFTTLNRRKTTRTPPLFIVGYWRSGTTHLHNLLSQSEDFGYVSPLAAGLPWDLLGIVRLFEPLLARALPEDRYVDNVRVDLDSPQEDSIPLAIMGAPSYYHGLFFPKRFAHHFRRGVFFEGCTPAEIDRWRKKLIYFLEKVSVHQGGRRLLIKNPVYTNHIGRLREIWPDAKFIHIYRNPFVVFQSTRHFFSRLMPELSLQSHDNDPIESLILDSYPRMLNQLFADAASVPQENFIQLRFEDLEQNPLGEVENIYQALKLPGLENARPHLKQYLSSIRDYRKNRYPHDPRAIRLVENHWGDLINRWNYTADYESK